MKKKNPRFKFDGEMDLDLLEGESTEFGVSFEEISHSGRKMPPPPPTDEEIEFETKRRIALAKKRRKNPSDIQSGGEFFDESMVSSINPFKIQAGDEFEAGEDVISEINPKDISKTEASLYSAENPMGVHSVALQFQVGDYVGEYKFPRIIAQSAGRAKEKAIKALDLLIGRHVKLLKSKIDTAKFSYKSPEFEKFARNPKKPWERAELQSLAFPRKEWTMKDAKKWAKSHGYSHGDVEKAANYWRLTQISPKEFDAFRWGEPWVSKNGRKKKIYPVYGGILI
jgi:hypothetical protein